VVVVVDVVGGGAGMTGAVVVCSVVVVVRVTGVGPQPAKATVPAISAMPTAMRSRGEMPIIV
jgi:hypothetical protein